MSCRSGLGLLFQALPVALSFIVMPTPAFAQGYALYFRNVEPAKFVADAFAHPYGQAQAAEFAVVVGDSADADCLKTKGMTRAQVVERARPIPQRRGIAAMTRVLAMPDWGSFETRLGAERAAEWKRLLDDQRVQAFRTAEEPLRLADASEFIIENISRYALIFRVKFARPFSPLEVDIPSLKAADPTDQIVPRLEKMIADDTSGTLERYAELAAVAEQELKASISVETAMKSGPGEWLADADGDREGLYRELVELCVAPPRN
jgi:hypothetical protein